MQSVFDVSFEINQLCLIDQNKLLEANGYKGFNIEIDRGNSLYLYSIGLYDIKDGKVSIVLEKN